LKHAWSANPLHPVYQKGRSDVGALPPFDWLTYPAGISSIGHDGKDFCFDNELPRHQTFLQGFQVANRLVTNGEYRAFIDDGGYRRSDLWLSDGWAERETHGWSAPLYWEPADEDSTADEATRRDRDWHIITLAGRRPVNGNEPVCHVSYYEADAFARWAGARLPTEAEWETAAAAAPVAGHFVEGGHFHPAASAATDDRGPAYQLYGDVWQWTASPYIGYPGYRPVEGALGEYNGKFMCNQFVLRGASCATPRSHARRSYRNFFPPNARWQFSGIRLAKEPA
jgi:ergothioneine biosynthesis protein EgtB